MSGGEARVAAIARRALDLTDLLAGSLEQTVIGELGLDRHPELRDDHFGGSRRAVRLAQPPTPATRASAQRPAAAVGLPLEERPVGRDGLERALETPLETAGPCR
jgi:hypothetical protein